MKKEVISKFFEEVDETGRHMVVSLTTGVRYFVEPIGDGRGGDWGSENPATKEIEHKKGDGKFTGSVTLNESLVTEENGFKEVKLLDPGESPMSEIERRDKIHEANGVKPAVKG